MPERLFHYQRFVEAHLISLLSEGKLKLSRPNDFNDPWDCRVHYRVPTTPEERARVIAYFTEVHRKHHPEISEAKRALDAYELKSNPSKLEATFVQMNKDMYELICNQYRLYCLTEKPDSPLMWGHYAGSHTGICLEFDARGAPFAHASKVKYRTTYPARDIVTTDVEFFITKSQDWSYEAEWRLIAEERAAARSTLTIKTDNDFLTLPPAVLKSVTIGSLADESSGRQIEHLVRSNAAGVIVRQATLAPDRYELRINPPF
jgi:hypothetical protein